MSSQFWEDDSAAPSCRSCVIEFTLRIRRHHCRTCGGVYCDEHSPYRQIDRGQPAVRTCSDCWENIKSRRRKAKEQESKSTNEIPLSPLAQEASIRKTNGGVSAEQRLRFGKPMLSSPTLSSRPQKQQQQQQQDMDEEEDESDIDDDDDESEGDTSESDDDENDNHYDNDDNFNEKGGSDDKAIDMASIDNSATASVVSSRAPSMRTSTKRVPEQIINGQRIASSASSATNISLSNALRKVSQLRDALQLRDDNLTIIVREMLSRLMKKEGETARLQSRLSLVTSHAAALRKRLLFPLQPLPSNQSSSLTELKDTNVSDEKSGNLKNRSGVSIAGHVCSNFVEVKLDDGPTGLRFTAATPSPLLTRIGDMRFSEYNLALAAIQPLSNGELSPAQRINAQLNRKACCERLRPGLLLTHINGIDIKGVLPTKAIAQFTSAKDRSLRFYNEPLVALHRQNADLSGKLHTLTAHTDALGASLELASSKIVSERARFRKHLAVLGASFLQLKRENESFRARLTDGAEERDGLKKRIGQLSQQLQQALSSAQEVSAKAANAMSSSSSTSSSSFTASESSNIFTSRSKNVSDASLSDLGSQLPAVSMSKIPVLIESYAPKSFTKSSNYEEDFTGREMQRNRGAALSMNTAFEGLEELTSTVLQKRIDDSLVDDGNDQSVLSNSAVIDEVDETSSSSSHADIVDPLFPTSAGQVAKTAPKAKSNIANALKLSKKSNLQGASKLINDSSNETSPEEKLIAQLKALSSSSTAIGSAVSNLLASPTASAASGTLQMKGTTGTGANLFLRARFARAPADSVEGHTHLVALIQRDNAILRANSAIKEAEEARALLTKAKVRENELLLEIDAERKKASALEVLSVKMANDKNDMNEEDAKNGFAKSDDNANKTPTWWRYYSDSFQKIALLEASEAKSALEIEVLRSRMKSLKNEVNQYRAKLEFMKSIRGITDDSASIGSGSQSVGGGGGVSSGKDAAGKRVKGFMDKVLAGKKTDSNSTDESAAPKKKTPKWRDVIMQAVSKKRKEEAAVAEAVNALLIGDVYAEGVGLSASTPTGTSIAAKRQPDQNNGVNGSGNVGVAAAATVALGDTAKKGGAGDVGSVDYSTQPVPKGIKMNDSSSGMSTREILPLSEIGVKSTTTDEGASSSKSDKIVPASSLSSSSSLPAGAGNAGNSSVGNPFSNPFISSSSSGSALSTTSSAPATLITTANVIEDDATLNARLSLLSRSIKAVEVKGDSFQRLLQSGTAQRAEGFVLVGYLYKASRDPGWKLFSSWAWRFVTVGAGSCTYYASEFADKPQSSFNLSDVNKTRVLASSESSKPLAFEFTLRNTKTFRFAMQTDIEKECWFKLFSALAVINEPPLSVEDKSDNGSSQSLDAEKSGVSSMATKGGGVRRKSVIQTAVKAMMRLRNIKGKGSGGGIEGNGGDEG
jgi:hypothetical protein